MNLLRLGSVSVTILGLVPMATLFVAPAKAVAHQDFLSDSGVDGPPYAEIVATMQALSASHNGWVQVFEYGASVDGRKLIALKIQAPDATGNENPAVLISGSIHGNEYLNIADRLPSWFLENRQRSQGVARFFASGGAIYIVPVVNPDGYERDSRYNSEGSDLNRDFDLIPMGENNFEQPETRQLAAFLEGEIDQHHLQLEVAVDYHCCDGSLLFPWSYTVDPLPANDLAGHRDIAEKMNDFIDPTYRSGSTGQVLGYYPRGTSKDYYYAKFGALAFTFEGVYRREQRKFQEHTAWWDSILGSLTD